MCGIAGLVGVDAPPDRSRLEAALSLLHHRGPDDEGIDVIQIPEKVGGGQDALLLGHRRLSIIDLSPAGRQPMTTVDGRYTIVYNGEIYNYRELRADLAAEGAAFTTDTDTEVLLQAWARWGEAALPKLKGMFAFAVFDRRAQKLVLVRDAFGIKPLFHALVPGGVAFASELPALLALLPARPALDAQQAYEYLVFGRYDDTQRTFFQGVQRLKSGHLLSLDLRTGQQEAPRRWWRPAIAERPIAFAEAVEILREMFLDSVRLHLRSDVPVGAALSGGVDSSAIVAAIRHVEPEMPITTFSFTARGSAVDEERWADLVNTTVGARCHKVAVSGTELAEDLDDLIRAQGEPVGGTSIYAQYRIFKRAREAGIKVVLEGQGADELFAGYHGYPGPALRSLVERGEIGSALHLMRRWSQGPGRGARLALVSAGRAFVPDWAWGLTRRATGRTTTPPWLRADILRDLGVLLHPPGPEPMASDGRGRRLAEALRHALTDYGLEMLLRHGDRNAMRWSIENRVPFLTPDLANFVLGLPEDYLLSPEGETKRIFRAAMRGIVPDAILDRRDKIGFATPESDWFTTAGRRVRDVLAEGRGVAFLDRSAALREFDAVIAGRRSRSEHVWRMVNLAFWAEMFNAG